MFDTSRLGLARVVGPVALVVPIVLAACSANDPTVDATATSTTVTTAAPGSGGALGGALGTLEPEATGAFVGEAAQRTLEAQTGSYYVSMTIDEGGPDELVFLQVEGTYDHDRGVAKTVLDISGMVDRAPEALSTDPDEQTAMKLVFGQPLEVVEDADTTYLRGDQLIELLGSPTDWITMPIEGDDTFGSIASAFEVGDLTEFLDGLDSAGEVQDLGKEELDGVDVWHYLVDVGDEGTAGGGLFGSIAGDPEDQGTVEVWVDEYGVIHKMTAVGSKAAVMPALGADFGGGDLATLDLGPGDVTVVIELYDLGLSADIDIPDESDTTPLDDL
jgi:hypothetical protein